jgi:hypothetical protein
LRSGADTENIKRKQTMSEQTDTPRETCETCYGLGRVDAVYAPCPDCELTAARAEIDMMGIRYAAAEMHHANNMQEVTEQRDRLKEALKDVMKSGDSTIMYRTAEAALQSLTNEKQ